MTVTTKKDKIVGKDFIHILITAMDWKPFSMSKKAIWILTLFAECLLNVLNLGHIYTWAIIQHPTEASLYEIKYSHTEGYGHRIMARRMYGAVI